MFDIKIDNNKRYAKDDKDMSKLNNEVNRLNDNSFFTITFKLQHKNVNNYL